ncbi:serine/threonine-protein kinase haspin [Nematocida sp. AWRm77]|nr:serine/threonine-protein kinase haspin [Nematocida sp. AWRm77]
MRTFRRRGRPGRRSFGVLAAPDVHDFSLDICARDLLLERKLGHAFGDSTVPAERSTVVTYLSFKDLPVKSMKKLGESTFSEIFVSTEAGRETLFKIVPLTVKKEYKRVQHTKVPHFIKEALVMEKMNASPHSVKLLNWWVVTGSYPASLMSACRAWAVQNVQEAENITPQKNNSSGMFGVIEMEYGGVELSKLEFGVLTPEQISQIISGIRSSVHHMNALGVEHRDLHESNVLVLQEKGFSVRVIDYSLSRVLWHGSSSESVEVKYAEDSLTYTTGEVLYTDIDKELPWVFEGTDGAPHREVYKKMNAVQTGADRWRHKGESNYFWMLYLINWVNAQHTKSIPSGHKQNGIDMA